MKVTDMNEFIRRSSTDLVQAAGARGTLSRRSQAALEQPTVASQIGAALKMSVSITRPAAILLVNMMPDDSGSMTDPIVRYRDSTPKRLSVIAGHNQLIEMMAAAPGGNRILLQTRYLNGTVLNPFSPLAHCELLTDDNYPCPGGTPLFAQTLVTLGTVIAKTEELTDLGATVRSATLIMTDGEATDSNPELAANVASVVRDIRNIGDHIVAGMGIGHSNFTDRFLEMGIDPKNIFPANSLQEIMEVFLRFTKSALALTARSGSGVISL